MDSYNGLVDISDVACLHVEISDLDARRWIARTTDEYQPPLVGTDIVWITLLDGPRAGERARAYVVANNCVGGPRQRRYLAGTTEFALHTNCTHSDG
jgi:hypothetical protein